MLNHARPPPRAHARAGAAAVLAPLVGMVAALVVLTATCPLYAAGLHRFALVAGNDTGGADTRPLLYASADARRVHDLFTQVGEVSGEDAHLLLNRNANDFLAALTALESRAAIASSHGERTALIVYYSGHAKDGDLRLGESHLPLGALKARLSKAAADVRIGIFDSCRSGVVSRTKGARRAPAFEIEADGGADTRGVVYLSSSSFDEDAQESDLIGGSYFSHHLVNGLRGSADRSGDGRVTLDEAYDYAYVRTVAETAETTAGAQHPTFSYDLKGNGDLVLTEPSRRREAIVVPASAPAGVYYVISAGVIAAEIVKPARSERRIAMPPGTYTIKRRLADRLRVGEVRVKGGEPVTLDESRLRDAPFTDDPVKGARRELGARVSLGVFGSVQSFLDAPTRDSLFPPTGLVGMELAVRDFLRRDWVWAFDVAFGGSQGTLSRPTVTLPFQFSELSLGTSMFAEWPLFDRRLVPFLGGRLALMVLGRTFDGTEIPKQFFATFSPGLVAGVRYQFAGGFSAVARSRVHYLLYNVEGNRSLGYFEFAGALSYEF